MGKYEHNQTPEQIISYLMRELDEAVELMREYDRETFHVKLPKKLRARLDDFIAKHGKDREEG